MIARRLVIGGLMVAGLMGATPTPAHGSLGAPVELTAAGQDAFDPDVALAPNGDAAFVWRRFDGMNWRIEARRRSAGGTLGPVHPLSTAGQDAEDPRVAIDSDGDAVFAWRAFDGTNFGVQARALSVAGVLSARQNVSPVGRDAHDPEVAIDPGGTAMFTWTGFDGANARVQGRARRVGGALTTVENLSEPGRDALSPAVAVDGDGDAVFAWRRFDGSNWRAQARERTSAGALSAVQTLSASGQNAYDPDVGVGSGGDAVFAWRRFDDEDFRVQARTRQGDGRLGTVATVSNAGVNVVALDLAVNARGDAAFVWRGSTPSDLLVQGATRSAAGELSDPLALSTGGKDPSVAIAGGRTMFAWSLDVPAPGGGSMSVAEVRTRTPDGVLTATQRLGTGFAGPLALSSGGNAVAVWAGHGGTNWQIRMATGPADASFGPARTLSASGQHGGTPQVDMDAKGNAVFAWTRFDGVNWRIQARARSAAGVLSPVATLSPAGQDAFEPDVGVVDGTGDAVFAWRRFDGTNWRIQTVARSATGALSGVQTLSLAGGDAYGPRMAVDGNGYGFFTWARFDGNDWRAQGRVRGTTGALSAVDDLSPAGEDAFDGDCQCRGPEIAVSTDGDAIFVWRRSDGANWRIQGRLRFAGGLLSSVADLSPAGVDADDHQVAAAANSTGDAVFAWRVGTNFADWRVQGRARSAAGTLRAVEFVSPSGMVAGYPQVAADADGDALFTWSEFTPSLTSYTHARGFTAAGTLSDPQCLNGCFPAGSSQVAMRPNGEALIAWTGSDEWSFRPPIQAQKRTAAGQLGAIQTIASRVNPSGLELALAANGAPVLAWNAPDNEGNQRVQVATAP